MLSNIRTGLQDRARDPKPLVSAGALEGFTGFLHSFAGLQICNFLACEDTVIRVAESNVWNKEN